jgi:hypothetical protein
MLSEFSAGKIDLMLKKDYSLILLVWFFVSFLKYPKVKNCQFQKAPIASIMGFVKSM